MNRRDNIRRQTLDRRCNIQESLRLESLALDRRRSVRRMVIERRYQIGLTEIKETDDEDTGGSSGANGGSGGERLRRLFWNDYERERYRKAMLFRDQLKQKNKPYSEHNSELKRKASERQKQEHEVTEEEEMKRKAKDLALMNNLELGVPAKNRLMLWRHELQKSAPRSGLAQTWGRGASKAISSKDQPLNISETKTDKLNRNKPKA